MHLQDGCVFHSAGREKYVNMGKKKPHSSAFYVYFRLFVAMLSKALELICKGATISARNCSNSVVVLIYTPKPFGSDLLYVLSKAKDGGFFMSPITEV